MHSQGTTSNVCVQDMKTTTKHGLLVAWGWVAQKLGLREALERNLNIKQKVYEYTPIDKVVETLVGILGNCEYMKDLTCEAEPIASDQAVAKAWGQDGFAHHSTVCATFAKLTPENLAQLSKALDEVQGPLLRKEVEALAGPDGQGLVVVDVDLSGQKVRGEAKQYTGTDFGYIKGKLARGYQIVAAFLSNLVKPTPSPGPACWRFSRPWKRVSVARSAGLIGSSNAWRSRKHTFASAIRNWAPSPGGAAAPNARC